MTLEIAAKAVVDAWYEFDCIPQEQLIEIVAPLVERLAAALPDDTSVQEERERDAMEAINESLHNGRVELTQHYHGGEDERVEHVCQWLEEHESLLTRLLVARTPQDVLDSDGEREEPEVSCARCAKSLTPGEIVCPNCGTERPQETERKR